MNKTLSFYVMAGVASAALLTSPVHAASFGSAATTTSSSEKSDKRSTGERIIATISNQVSTAFSFFVLKAGHSSEEKNKDIRFYSEETCTQEETPIDDETEASEEIKKAEASGPEPIYFGF